MDRATYSPLHTIASWAELELDHCIVCMKVYILIISLTQQAYRHRREGHMTRCHWTDTLLRGIQ